MSIHEKVEAKPDTPEIKASKGVMRHKEAAIAESIPAPANPDLLIFILLFFMICLDDIF